MTDVEIKKAQLEYAENRFVGFFHAKKGYDIKALADSMGLTKSEWEKIKRTMASYFSQEDIQDIDSLFS